MSAKYAGIGRCLKAAWVNVSKHCGCSVYALLVNDVSVLLDAWDITEISHVRKCYGFFVDTKRFTSC